MTAVAGSDPQALLARVLPAEALGTHRLPDVDRVGGADGEGERPLAAPRSEEEWSEVLRLAGREGWACLVVGRGSKPGWTRPPKRVDLVLSTRGYAGVVAYEPGDGTVTARAGSTMDEIAREVRAGGHHLTPDVPRPGASTLGGVVAAGQSGLDRLRFGPVRHNVLGMRVALADGSIAKTGGRLVKNVTGYDLPRLAAGSLGSLGVITQVCLKLWPKGARFAGVPVDDPVDAYARAYKPLAILETEAGSTAYFSGMSEEVDAQAAALGGAPVDDPRWPRPLDSPAMATVRVPARLTREAVDRVRRLGDGIRFRAAHGVGEVVVGAVELPAGWVTETRAWAEAAGGALVITKGAGDLDPWGTPPASLPLQKKVKAAFDPIGISNPGRLPGGL